MEKVEINVEAHGSVISIWCVLFVCVYACLCLCSYMFVKMLFIILPFLKFC